MIYSGSNAVSYETNKSKETTIIIFLIILTALKHTFMFLFYLCKGKFSSNISSTSYGRERTALYFGAIGDDSAGEETKEFLDNEGIGHWFDVHEGCSTDICAVVIVGGERTPVPLLNVNNLYRTEHIKENLHLLRSCKVILTESFFISSNFDAMMIVINYAKDMGITFAFNLGGEFWIENYIDMIKTILPYTDILFGNYQELACLTNKLGFKSFDPEECIRFIVDYNSNKDNEDALNEKKKTWLALISMDKNGAILDSFSPSTRVHKIIKVPSIKLDDHEVVDTSCAGDSFVGGFLAGYLNGKDFESSIKDGHCLAAKVIQSIGCSFE